MNIETKNYHDLIQYGLDEALLTSEAAEVLSDSVIAGHLSSYTELWPEVSLGRSKNIHLIKPVIDDSGSVVFASLDKTILEGFDQFTEAISKDVRSKKILISNSLMSRGILTPFAPIRTNEAKRTKEATLSAEQYEPAGPTPLHFQYVISCAHAIIEVIRWYREGFYVRPIILLISEGPNKVPHYERDLNRFKTFHCRILTQTIHQVQGVTIALSLEDDPYQDPIQTFIPMGIPQTSVHIPRQEPGFIPKAMKSIAEEILKGVKDAKSYRQFVLDPIRFTHAEESENST